MKKVGWLTMLVCAAICLNMAAAAEDNEDAMSALRHAQNVWWYGGTWAEMVTNEEQFQYLDLTNNLIVYDYDPRECWLFAVNGEDYLNVADSRLIRLSDGEELMLPDVPIRHINDVPIILDGDRVLCEGGTILDLKTMTATEPADPQMLLGRRGMCWDRAYVECGPGYFDCEKQCMVHMEIDFTNMAGGAPVLDGYAFGDRLREDGSSEAVVVCLATSEVVHAFDGEWADGGYDGGQSSIFSDGTAAVNNGEADNCSVVNWRTGEVLVNGEEEPGRKNEWHPEVWSWTSVDADGEETARYYSVRDGAIVEEYPADEMQRQLAAEGVEAFRTYDGYYVSFYREDHGDYGTIVYDEEHGELFRTYDYPGDVLSGIVEGMSGNAGLFQWWGYCSSTTDNPVIRTSRMDGENGNVYLGAFSREDGPILPMIYDEVKVAKGAGFIVRREGEWYLLDRQGRLLY